MVADVTPDDARRETELRRQQIAEERRELAETLAALHDKVDVAGRVRDKATGVELAAAGFVRGAGRGVQAPLQVLGWAAARAGDQVQRIPRQVRAPVESILAAVRDRRGVFPFNRSQGGYAQPDHADRPDSSEDPHG